MEWEFESLDIDKSAWKSFIKACHNHACKENRPYLN